MVTGPERLISNLRTTAFTVKYDLLSALLKGIFLFPRIDGPYEMPRCIYKIRSAIGSPVTVIVYRNLNASPLSDATNCALASLGYIFYRLLFPFER